MQVELPTELIQEVQILFRKEAGIFSFHHEDPSISDLPSVSDSISQLEPSPSQYRCQHCNGRLLRDDQSIVCVYCGGEQKRETPPDPLHYRNTLGFRWLLGSLDLDGSEIVGPPVDADEVKNDHPTSKENVSISDLLDFEIKWYSRSDKLQSKTPCYASHFRKSSEFLVEDSMGSLSQPWAEKAFPNASEPSEIASGESAYSPKFQNTTIPSLFLSDEQDSAADISTTIDTGEPAWEASFQSDLPLTDDRFGDFNAHSEDNIFLQEHQWQSSVANAPEKNGGFEHHESFDNWNNFSVSSPSIGNYHDSSIREFFSDSVSPNGKIVSEDLFISGVVVVQAETSNVGKQDIFSAASNSNSQNDFMPVDNMHSENLFFASGDSDEKGSAYNRAAMSMVGDASKDRKDAEILISEMHDLCFMLEQELCIPSNPTKLP